jgi:exonuclease V gamma subunit
VRTSALEEEEEEEAQEAARKLLQGEKGEGEEGEEEAAKRILGSLAPEEAQALRAQLDARLQV